MREEILSIKNEAIAQIMDVESKVELENLRIKYLGKKGKITGYIKQLKELEPDEKRSTGRLVNEVKTTIENAITEQQKGIINKRSSENKWFDPTTPGEKPDLGHLHPQTLALTEILDIFKYLGYQTADGPEIETERYNFEMLNFKKDHPARDAQQTMFFDTAGTKFKLGELVPRTQTSSMQGRVMEKMKPPFRVVVPGRCFRYEQVDASHGVEFWQVEGFVVDKNIRFTDLLGTIKYVLTELFGEDSNVKFAATYFPFVEPGVDAYLECTICNGRGCTFCKNSGWSEIMPAGMIHPNVLKMSGIDPNLWNGFAFAIGLSRVVTLRYGISDLRILNTPDIRILKQF